MKNSKEIRDEFMEFFKSKNHTFVPSSSVIPGDDPSLLFTNAGMNQFKDVFLDSGTRPYRRAVNSQKCIRVSGKHNDLEEVGQDTYHHTFFEMLGNWSFGDYYKKEAITWAWELFTKIWNLPKNNLWATVYKDDDEAADFWMSQTDVNPQQILRFGDEDNFWEMGETGPCGPSSEIHIDLGEAACDKRNQKNHLCKVNGGCGRYIELWNLVFIQYNKDSEGVIHPLPKKHVDTGMGFERIVAVLQNVSSNYETDLFTPLLNAIENITQINYFSSDEPVKAVFRVLADHVRMLTFAITDGSIPSNEGRGYVLRRILRRAARFARHHRRHPQTRRGDCLHASVLGPRQPDHGIRVTDDTLHHHGRCLARQHHIQALALAQLPRINMLHKAQHRRSSFRRQRLDAQIGAFLPLPQ